MKARVWIEETLCKTIEVDVPENIENANEYAEEKVEEMYRRGDIVLTSDNFTGVVQMSSQAGETTTDWHEIVY